MKRNNFLLLVFLSFIFACGGPIEVPQSKNRNTNNLNGEINPVLDQKRKPLGSETMNVYNSNEEKSLKNIENRYVEENLPIRSIEILKNEIENFVLEVKDFLEGKTSEVKPIWIKNAVELMKDINAYEAKGNSTEVGGLKNNLLPSYEKLNKLYDDTVVRLDAAIEENKKFSKAALNTVIEIFGNEQVDFSDIIIVGKGAFANVYKIGQYAIKMQNENKYRDDNILTKNREYIEANSKAENAGLNMRCQVLEKVEESKNIEFRIEKNSDFEKTNEQSCHFELYEFFENTIKDTPTKGLFDNTEDFIKFLYEYRRWVEVTGLRHGDFHPGNIARLPNGRWLLFDMEKSGMSCRDLEEIYIRYLAYLRKGKCFIHPSHSIVPLSMSNSYEKMFWATGNLRNEINTCLLVGFMGLNLTNNREIFPSIEGLKSSVMEKILKFQQAKFFSAHELQCEEPNVNLKELYDELFKDLNDKYHQEKKLSDKYREEKDSDYRSSRIERVLQYLLDILKIKCGKSSLSDIEDKIKILSLKQINEDYEEWGIRILVDYYNLKKSKGEEIADKEIVAKLFSYVVDDVDTLILRFSKDKLTIEQLVTMVEERGNIIYLDIMLDLFENHSSEIELPEDGLPIEAVTKFITAYTNYLAGKNNKL